MSAPYRKGAEQGARFIPCLLEVSRFGCMWPGLFACARVVVLASLKIDGVWLQVTGQRCPPRGSIRSECSRGKHITTLSLWCSPAKKSSIISFSVAPSGRQRRKHPSQSAAHADREQPTRRCAGAGDHTPCCRGESGSIAKLFGVPGENEEDGVWVGGVRNTRGCPSGSIFHYFVNVRLIPERRKRGPRAQRVERREYRVRT